MIPTCTQCCAAARQRVEGWMGSKEVTYLRKLLSNGGLDHGGRAGPGCSVAQGLQAAQEASRRAPPLPQLRAVSAHFRAGDGPGALCGCSGRVVTTAPPSRATVPPPQHTSAIRASSTWLRHACEYRLVSACLYMICVARSRLYVHTSSHRCMILFQSLRWDYT